MCSVRFRVGFEKPEAVASAESADRRNPVVVAGAVRLPQAENKPEILELTDAACTVGLESTATCFPRKDNLSSIPASFANRRVDISVFLNMMYLLLLLSHAGLANLHLRNAPGAFFVFYWLI